MRASSLTFLFLLLCVPQAASAQVVISEVMYDIEGADTGREWVEVFNAGSSAVDITTWRLLENEVNHTIKEVLGGATLPAGGYAVVADNTAKFLEDWPAYSGLLFDSAFSLSNTGETLALRDQDLLDRDILSYTSEHGAAGDGNSLHRASVGSTSLSPAAPTPGSGSLSAQATSPVADTPTPEAVETVPAAEKSTASGTLAEPQLFAYAGKDRRTLVGADTIFSGRALNKEGEPVSGNVRYVWNFGDGSTAEGQTVMHHFKHPGTYSVLLQVASGFNAGSHRITITAEVPAFALLREDGALVLQNKSTFDLDISFFHIRSGGDIFSIPEGTLLLKGTEIVFDPAITRLPTAGEYALLFPNGAVVEMEQVLPTATESKVAFASRPLSQALPAPQRQAGYAPVPRVAEEAVEPAIEARAALGEPQAAAAAESAFPGWAWMLGLVGIVGVGVLGVLLASNVDEEWAAVDAGPDLR